jgi:hypothetical protein
VEHGDSTQKHNLRQGLYNEIFQSWNNVNASSIRWSMAASKLEQGRLHCNLLDSLALSNLAT